jgi:hypothetical protein
MIDVHCSSPGSLILHTYYCILYAQNLRIYIEQIYGLEASNK